MNTNKNQSAWAAFYDRVYVGDFPYLSDLLGSDWAAHLPVNKTGSQYRAAAYRQMLATYGDEEIE